MVFSPLYFRIFIFHFLFNFYFYPPNPPNPPNIYFMIRNIYRNIIKEWEMVRKKVRGVIGGQDIFRGVRIRIQGGRIWEVGGGIFATVMYTQGCSTHLPTFAYFQVFITTINDGNIYIEYHMDFLRNHAHLAGGDTRKTPKNTQFSKSRHTTRGQGSPPRQPLSIHQITANPLNPF